MSTSTRDTSKMVYYKHDTRLKEKSARTFRVGELI